MIKENQRHFNRILILLDMLSLLLALILSWYTRFYSGLIDVEGTFMPFNEYIRPMAFVIPIYIAIYTVLKLYTPQRFKSVFDEFISIIKANVIGILIFILVLFMFKEIDYSRYFLFVFFVYSIIISTLERITLRVTLRRIRKKGYNLKHILIIGVSDCTLELLKRIKLNRQWGYNCIGILDDNNYKGYEIEGCKVIGKTDKLEKCLSIKDVDEVFITLNIKEYDKLKDIIEICEKLGVRTQIVPDYYRYIPAKPYIEDIDGLPLINIRYVPLDSIINKVIKRVFDIIISSLCIVIFSPIMILTTIIIKITSPGPIIFKQERVGYNKKTFMMYKFRSMKVQREDEEKSKWTTKDDPRKTKFGNFIRRTSIDELPQIFNVLRGDMSLIGPRPERPYFVDQFKEEIPKYMIKHQVRPGMTGWAQVNGWRGDTSIKNRIECDLYYIENWSFWLDIKIIFMTILKGFINRNAY